jgi:heme exporter protein A
MLTLENLSCSRAGNTLFKNLGFTIGDNCILVISGKQGSGKTTLLETLACLRKAKEGRVLYANKNVRDGHYKEYCDIIQYIGHKSAVKMQLTVGENLKFWAVLKNNIAAMPAALAFFGLEKYTDVPCGTLSAGYQKRVSLARLMVTNAEIWLLDEPFTDLGEEEAHILATLIMARCERGGSVIITANGAVPFKDYTAIELAEFRC